MSRDYTFAFGSNPASNTGLSPTFIFFVNAAGATIAPPAVSELITGSGLYKVSYNATQMISFTLDGATTGLSSNDRYIVGVFDPADKFSSTLVGVGVTLGAMGTTLAAAGTTLAAMGGTLTAIGTGVAANTTAIGTVSTNLTNQGTTLVAYGGTLSAIATSTTGLGSSMTALGSSLVSAGDTLGTMAALMGSTLASFGTDAADPTTLFGFMRRLQELGEGGQVYTKASGAFALYSRGSSTLLRSLTVSDDTTSTTRE